MENIVFFSYTSDGLMCMEDRYERNEYTKKW